MTAAADLDPHVMALIADTRALLQRSDAMARAARSSRAAAPARLREAHQRGLHPVAGAAAVALGLCAECWAERLAWLDQQRYNLRTIAGRLARDLDVIERRMAADPGKAWQWLDTHRELRERLAAEEDRTRIAR